MLTLNRFEFDAHWLATNNTIYSHFGSGPTEVSPLSSTSNIGFHRPPATGGELLVNFANNLVFTFSPVQHTIWPSNFSAALVQPLLQNAGLRVRLEGLTQGERELLYQVRTFARFRKQFYFSITSGAGGYLPLLQQVQNIRNLENNLEAAEYNYQVNLANAEPGVVTAVAVDQAFQQYQTARQSLIQARAGLESALDNYKILLGLPPDVSISLDDAPIKEFQLVSPDLEKLQKQIKDLFREHRKFPDVPPVARLRADFEQLKAFQQRLVRASQEVETELERWRNLTAAEKDPMQVQAETTRRRRLEAQMPRFREGLDKLDRDMSKDQSALAEGTRKEKWDRLKIYIDRLRAEIDELYIVQTQVRVFLIRLKPIPYALEEASEFARSSRLDLMNQRAQVVDAWRKIEVEASALKAGLALQASANVATKPDSTNPVDFRASASQYTIGFTVDGPLNRMAERNNYVASLIAYQQARRSFMASDDLIQVSIRQDIRQLELERTNFELARQNLVSAARSAEQASILLENPISRVTGQENTTATLDVVTTLNSLLNAKSGLISSWINYETGRTRLLLDMDALQLDPEGLPAHEHDNKTSDDRGVGRISPAERLPPAVPEPGDNSGS